MSKGFLVGKCEGSVQSLMHINKKDNLHFADQSYGEIRLQFFYGHEFYGLSTSYKCSDFCQTEEVHMERNVIDGWN